MTQAGLFSAIDLGFNGVLALASLAIFVVKVVALVDAALRPARYWAAASENKTLWLVILGLTALFGFFSLLNPLSLAGDVAVIVYLVDRRPKVRAIQRGDNRR